MDDHIIRTVSISGSIRLLACTAGMLAREVCSLQQASATASIALGRGLAGGALMGALLKSGQRVALKFEGNGPLRRMIVEADSDGAVRACAANPSAEVGPLGGRWDVPGLLGRAGFLTVTRDLGLGKEPYSGTVQLCTSEIGDDLAYYLTDSEQVPSAVGLTAALDQEGRLSLCGGFLAQALPKADDSDISAVMERIATLPPLAELLQEGGPGLLARRIFGDMPYIAPEERRLFFRCGCSRQKVERALISLGGATLEDMLRTEKGAEVTCEFCRQRYQFDRAGLEALAAHCRSDAPGDPCEPSN
jgi:molecular chaperone Hsp33